MPQTTRKAQTPAQRMAAYRQRMRAQGLRPKQIWMPDTKSPEFIAECRRQSLALAAIEKEDDELMSFLEKIQDWPPE